VTLAVRLGLRANAAQFSLLVALNVLVGAMVGIERSVLPLVGKEEFGLRSTSAILGFVVAFGLPRRLPTSSQARLPSGSAGSGCSSPAGRSRCRSRSSSRWRRPGGGLSPRTCSSA
jgi:hypothetical protein